MTCQEVDELAAAYALGAVASDERRRVQQHLAGCDAHVELLSHLGSAVDALGSEVPVVEPGANLKSQIMAAIEPARRATPAAAAAPARARFRLPALRLQPAVVLLSVLVAGLLAWNLALQFGGGDDSSFVRYMQNGEDIHGWVYFVEEAGVITVEGLDPLPADRAYQAWALLEGQMTSLGLIPVSQAGEGFILLTRHVTDNVPVFITIESAGGGAAPSGSTVLTTEQ